MASKCKACGAQIIWGFRFIPDEERIDKTGHRIGVVDTVPAKPNPINAEYSKEGNIYFPDDSNNYLIVLPIDREQEPYKGHLHLSHFATCPARDKFKRSGKK